MPKWKQNIQHEDGYDKHQPIWKSYSEIFENKTCIKITHNSLLFVFRYPWCYVSTRFPLLTAAISYIPNTTYYHIWILSYQTFEILENWYQKERCDELAMLTLWAIPWSYFNSFKIWFIINICKLILKIKLI